MAMKRFPCEMFASIELNQVHFQHAIGQVVSQMPLGEEFTKDAPCENGMWLTFDKSEGNAHSAEAASDAVGVVFTTEKEYDYDPYHYGLKTFGRKIAGDYPRIGVFSVNDTITSNCFQYDDGEFADEDALFEALKAHAETPVFVCVEAGSPVPKLTATEPAEGIYAKVCKFYTMPNGEPGVKYQIKRV